MVEKIREEFMYMDAVNYISDVLQKTKSRSSNTGSILDNNSSNSLIPDISSTDDNCANIANIKWFKRVISEE